MDIPERSNIRKSATPPLVSPNGAYQQPDEAPVPVWISGSKCASDDSPFRIRTSSDLPTTESQDIQSTTSTAFLTASTSAPAKEEQESLLFIPFFSIPRTEIMGDDNYIAYVIEMNDGTRNEIYLRRYSQFAELNESLKKLLPAVLLPPFPPKTLFKKSSREFLDLRRLQLESYLQGITQMEAARESAEFKNFFTEKARSASVTENSYWKGKRICIFGASSGIGEELAVQYAGKGDIKLVLVARREDRLKRVAERCRQVGLGTSLEITIMTADITIQEHCRKVIENNVNVNGGVDVLVFSVGQGMHAKFEEVSDLSLLHRITNVNYFGLVNCTFHALPVLTQSRGQIVVVSAAAGKLGIPNATFYAGAKHAIHGFFNSLRNEQDEVSITLVCPGYVNTEAHSKMLNGSGNPCEIKLDVNQLMEVELCASKIIEAAKNKKSEVMLDTNSAVGATVQTIIPSLVDYQVKKKVEAMIINED